MATRTKKGAKRAGIQLAPDTMQAQRPPVPFGTGVFVADTPYCVNVVRGAVRFGPWSRERFNAKELHGTVQLEFNPKGYAPVVQTAVAWNRIGDPLEISGLHNFDTMEVDEFDAFVSLMVSLRDALFASGMVKRPKLVPLPTRRE